MKILKDLMEETSPLVEIDEVDFNENEITINPEVVVEYKGYTLVLEVIEDQVAFFYEAQSYMNPGYKDVEIISIDVNKLELYDSEGDLISLSDTQIAEIKEWVKRDFLYKW